MRELFNKQLAELRQELVSIYTDIDLELHEALQALVSADKAHAKRVKEKTRQIDQRCAELEDKAYELIVLQQPVASDLRLLQFIIYVDFNLARISNHVRNIAKSAKRASATQVPSQFMDLLESMGHLVYRVLGTAIEAIVESDLTRARSLPDLDEPVDHLYKQFFRAVRGLSSSAEIDAVGRVLMAARMLERISDNAVETGERLIFLLTGHRQSLRDLAEMDDDEISDLYVARGAALELDAEHDMELLNQIPEFIDGKVQDPQESVDEDHGSKTGTH